MGLSSDLQLAGSTDRWDELHLLRGNDRGDDHQHHDAAPQRVARGSQEDEALLQPGLLQLLQLEGRRGGRLEEGGGQEQGSEEGQALREEEDEKGRKEENVAAKKSQKFELGPAVVPCL